MEKWGGGGEGRSGGGRGLGFSHTYIAPYSVQVFILSRFPSTLIESCF